MIVEDWKTYKRQEVEIKKDVRDEVHEFLTKVFNVYMVRLPPTIFKQLDVVRDKLIALTTRFDKESYDEFCETFSKVYRLIIVDKDVSEDVKKVVRELSERTNSFFASKGMHACVKELRYHVLRVKVLFEKAPLKDAAVAVEADGRVVASCKTDEGGTCVLEVPEGKFTVYVYKFVRENGYIYEEKSVSVPVDTEITFDVTEVKTSAEVARERGGRPLIREVS